MIAHQPNYYDISANCDTLLDTGLVHLNYFNNQFIETLDYENYYNILFQKTFKFRFAVSGLNAIGYCPSD